jgi:hypothetical protein
MTDVSKDFTALTKDNNNDNNRKAFLTVKVIPQYEMMSA